MSFELRAELKMGKAGAVQDGKGSPSKREDLAPESPEMTSIPLRNRSFRSKEQVKFKVSKF